MDWVEIKLEDMLGHMPTDVKVRYEAWLVANPDRTGRLEEIIENTIREFRDNIKSVPHNIIDPRENWVPQSAIRHLETIVYFSLAMEMGLPLDSAAIGVRYAADIFLRQILMGRYRTTTDAAGTPSPHFSIPKKDNWTGRALPVILALLLSVQQAVGGWIRPDSGPLDTDVATTFLPSAYPITSATLFSHLQGINQALIPMATTNYVNQIFGGVVEHDPAFLSWLTGASPGSTNAILSDGSLLDISGMLSNSGVPGDASLWAQHPAVKDIDAGGHWMTNAGGVRLVGLGGGTAEMRVAYTSGRDVFYISNLRNIYTADTNGLYINGAVALTESTAEWRHSSLSLSHELLPDSPYSLSLPRFGPIVDEYWTKVQITTTNAEQRSNSRIHIYIQNEGVLVFVADFLPSCKGLPEDVWFPAIKGTNLYLSAMQMAPAPAVTDAPPVLTTVRVYRAGNPKLVGRTIETANQILSVDDPERPRQAANQRYVDNTAQAALQAALQEIRSRTSNTDLQGRNLRFNPRYVFQTTNELFTLNRGGSVVWQVDGTDALIVPDVTAMTIGPGNVIEVVVWAQAAGASNLVPEVSADLSTWTRLGPEDILSVNMVDEYRAKITFSNSAPYSVFVRLVDPTGGGGLPLTRLISDTEITGNLTVQTITLGTNAPTGDWPEGGGGGGGLTTEQAGQIATNVVSTATTNDMAGIDWGSLGGGGSGGSGFFGLPSIVIDADWEWQADYYAVGGDTSTTNVAIALPDLGTNYATTVIRKFSNANQLEIVRGTNVVWTLTTDGSAITFDWWPNRTNWYWRTSP